MLTKLNNVYPTIEDLLPYGLRAILPQTLVEEVTERYENLGTKYLTENKTPDGKFINNMLYSDRLVNCREEVVDAVFCILGQIFKDIHHGDREPSDYLHAMLQGLIDIYSLGIQVEENQDYTNVSP